MKKIASVFIIVILLLTPLAGCSSNANSEPLRGEASRITFTDGWTVTGVTFEYINENNVKIVRNEDGQIFYVPISSIERIWVTEEG